MRLLIDTHVLLWFISDPTKLSSVAVETIENPVDKVLVSTASLIEIAIKNSLGRLEVEGGFDALRLVLREIEVEILSIDFEHVSKLNRLPFHHKDPFDRIIASQALAEQIDLVSVDDDFDKYFEGSEVKRIW